MKRLPFVSVLALAIPSFGFTNCQYFTQVAIAANDTQPPIVGTRMWVDGVESIRPGDSVSYTTSGDVVIFPFVYDSGGAWTLGVQQTIEVYCHNYDLDPEESQVTNIVFFDKFEQQPAGSPGQLRSNGIFTSGDVTDLSGYADYCYNGFDLETVTYSWTVVGRDYGSNQSTSEHSVIYAP
jgi:hypothetical protein